MEEDSKFVHLQNKIAKITPTKWDYDFDPDKIFKIDPYNLFGEVITIPVLVNRLGVLVSEMRNWVKQEGLKLEEKEAEARKLFRGKADKKLTIQELDDLLLTDPLVKNLRLKLFRLKKDLEDIESLHESAKQKGFLLNNLSKNLTPEDFENDIIEGTVNGVFIQLRDKKYK